jgi:ATP-dependent helicase/nuclease subunit A
MTAAEIGVAHHTFLEFADPQLLATVEGVRAEAGRLVKSGSLTETEAAHLDPDALAHFWSSQLGQRIRSAQDVRRELPFTARFDCSELTTLGLATGEVPAGEFIVIQGVADLAVLLKNEIWLVDFKTDDVSGQAVNERAEQYRPQLAAYAAALERIYPGRRVTRRCLHFLSARQTVQV